MIDTGGIHPIHNIVNPVNTANPGAAVTAGKIMTEHRTHMTHGMSGKNLISNGIHSTA